MPRRSLKPQLNQIRAWVRQGRTDAWIAHQLEISATELRDFREQHDLSPDDEDASSEIDLRDEIEAEIEAATAEEEKAEAEEKERKAAEPDEDEDADGDGDEDGDGDGDGETRPRPRRRRRGRRGGRGRRKALEATFDHGETDGYGLWLDPAIKDNPVYAEHWAGKREVLVSIDADQIVIRRPAPPSPEGDDGDGE
jgi:hypothetical protein